MDLQLVSRTADPPRERGRATVAAVGQRWLPKAARSFMRDGAGTGTGLVLFSIAPKYAVQWVPVLHAPAIEPLAFSYEMVLYIGENAGHRSIQT